MQVLVDTHTTYGLQSERYDSLVWRPVGPCNILLSRAHKQAMFLDFYQEDGPSSIAMHSGTARMGTMEPQDWLACPLISSDPEIVHGEPVFKGTRLPVETITDNVDAYMELQGQSLDQAIASTLESFPDTPGGAEAIRAVLTYRDIHQHQLQL
jgi:uncharacterized protein (DUF433 family)